MRQIVSRVAVTGLFTVSLGVVAATFATVASAAASPLDASCPACQLVTLTCPGSPCNCEWNDFGQKYQCVRPPPN